MSFSLRCKDQLLLLNKPIVMGILNLTPDSFFDGGRLPDTDTALLQAEKMLQAGATILDIGGASSRPGAEEVPLDTEKKRVLPVIEAIADHFPEAILSIDSWRSEVCREAIEAGAHIINDISAGRFDLGMYPLAGELAPLGVPYILMHMQGRPETMQQQPHYEDVVQEVLDFFIAETGRLRDAGVVDIILDPGFGFGKTVAHNFSLLRSLESFSTVSSLPVLAGLSRKSMICKTLHVSPQNALNGTTALNMAALIQGARILRVHDVPEAMETIRLYQAMYPTI